MSEITGYFSRLRVLGLTLCAVLGAGHPNGTQAQNQLPDFGDSSSLVLSGALDRELGEAFMREVRATLTISDDPEVEAYIRSLGAQLGARGTDSFEFFVVMSDGINAFAGPGGHVGINSGLITTTQSESELASVVAHEIAHVTQRHLARAYEQAQGLSVPVLAGLLAAVLIGTQNPQAGQAAASAVIGTQIQQQLDFSRAKELEADRVGMRLLADSGFEPRAMPRFFERLQNAARYYRKPPEWLSTHPLTTSRISDSLARAERYPGQPSTSSLEYHLVRAKLARWEAFSAGEAIAHFRESINTSDGNALVGARYGLALALIADAQYTEAQKELQELVLQHPNHPSLVSALAEATAGAGEVERALTLYARGRESHPGNALLALGQARLLIDNQHADDALAALAQFARSETKTREMFRIEAQAHELKKERAQAHMALAEFYYLDGDLDSAIKQLLLAQQTPDGDFYTRSRIDARLQELEIEFSERQRQRE